MPSSSTSHKVVVSAAVLALGIVVSACSTTKQDRPESQPDFVEDVTDVTLYRNADNIPNVAFFCAGNERFAATLSADGARSPELVHLGPCSG